MKKGSSRPKVSPLPEWRRISPICPTRPCRASLAASCRTGAPQLFRFDADFQIENYLRYQGTSFVDRFDANSYLYVTRACDYFDLAADYGGSLAYAFKGSKSRFCVVSFNSDWLYPTQASRAIVHALNAGGASVSFVDIETDRGHDAFLLDTPEFIATSRGFLDAAARARGIAPAKSPAGHLSVTTKTGVNDPSPSMQFRRASISCSSRIWSSQKAAFSMSDAATARCCGCSPKKNKWTRAASSFPSAASTTVSPRGCRSFRGMPTPILPAIPTMPSIMSFLSQTLQATRQPRKVLEQMLRIGRHAIVSFPNFGHWRIRCQVAFGGRMPLTRNLSCSPGMRRPTSIFARSRISSHSCRRSMRGSSVAWRSITGQAAPLQRAVDLEPVRRTRRLPAHTQAVKDIKRNCFKIKRITLHFPARSTSAMILPRLLGIAPALDLDPFARFEILVMGKEMLELTQRNFWQIGISCRCSRNAWLDARTGPRRFFRPCPLHRT